MKRTLFLSALLAACFSHAYAAKYTDLTNAWCDEENNVIYDGKGYFAVESAGNTSVELTISLSSLVSYVNSNDYKSGGYMLLWDDNAADYGLADNADTSVDNGSREPYISGYWAGAAWNASTNNILYSELNQYAVNDSLTLYITNSSTAGVVVSAKNTAGESVDIYTADALKSGSNTVTNGYYVNLNYVTGVTLNTTSTLDTGSYVPPVDYSQPFVSQRTDGTTVGRVTFLGDSITHGVDDQSYRWQFFKILTDNGIENEIVGPREGYYSTPGHTEDAGSSYGSAEFANVHLAQASGRTHNIISGSTTTTVNGTEYSSGVNYGGHSTASTAESFDSNTWFCMMGTNDMLSDGGASTTDYCNKMAKMFGGSVSYSEEAGYTWTADSSYWGTMGTIVSDVYGEGDTFYMLSITPWTQHKNSNTESYHFGALEFNRNLEAWTQAYSAATGTNVVYVDVTRGLVDKTSSVSFYSPGAFFNAPGTDGLHPNDQGSIIMAGNLARAMGIGGRTAGLQRMGTTSWSGATVGTNGTVAAGEAYLYGENAFTMEGGYTVDFSANFGDGAANGWSSADNALSISLGDGTNSGTLNLSEGYIMWGSDVLFCWDNSTLAEEGNIRIAWHNGNTTDNVLSGYYVWLGDMLIGQGLNATEGQGLNGIIISASGANGTVNNLTWTDTAYAPTTEGMVSTENAYLTQQDAAAVSDHVSNTSLLPMPITLRVNTADTSGVDYSSVTTGTAVNGGATLVTNSTATDTKTIKLTSAAGWSGITNCNHSGDINVQVTGKTVSTIFGTMNGADAGNLTLEVVSGAEIGNGTYSGQTAAIAGAYNNANAKSFNLFVHGGQVMGDIVGGTVNNGCVIEKVNLTINNGTVNGSVIGGSKTNGKVVSASIVINGGTITGDINAGGNGGAIGDTSVTIKGGVIKGNIVKGNASRINGGQASVTVEGNKAKIGTNNNGSITADTVTFRDVTASSYSDGFDKYSGTVTAEKLTLDNVNVDVLATLDVKAIEVVNGSSTSVILGDTATLATLTLDSDTVFGAFKAAEARTADTASETTISVGTLTAGTGATLNANLKFSASSTLNLAGSLAMGSSVELASGMTLGLSPEMLEKLYSGVSLELFTGVDSLTLDDVDITAGTTLPADDIFSGLSADYTYEMGFNGGVVSLSATMVPEPSTATLSLLALAALAARRRRR